MVMTLPLLRRVVVLLRFSCVQASLESQTMHLIIDLGIHLNMLAASCVDSTSNVRRSWCLQILNIVYTGSALKVRIPTTFQEQ